MKAEAPDPNPPRSVREAAWEIWRQLEMTTIFANPGSTEIALLGDLPKEMNLVLGLHEGSVIGMATGFALAQNRPALALLHTTAGLGNAVGALATARVNRAPLVVIIGQQDRRHLISQPFLAGELDGLAGSYPVFSAQPVLARDVPTLMLRAWHEARAKRGPALLIVPMDDWEQTAELEPLRASPAKLDWAISASPHHLGDLATMINQSEATLLVVGADADSAPCWSALADLAEKLDAPVWQEPFGARAGFAQDHRLFAGHLPASRGALREVLWGYDMILVVGAPAFRQYPFEEGAFTRADTRVAVLAGVSWLASDGLRFFQVSHGISAAAV